MGPLVAALIAAGVQASGQIAGGVMANKDAEKAASMEAELQEANQAVKDQATQFNLGLQKRNLLDAQQDFTKQFKQKEEDTKTAMSQARQQSMSGLLEQGRADMFGNLNRKQTNLMRRAGQLG